MGITVLHSPLISGAFGASTGEQNPMDLNLSEVGASRADFTSFGASNLGTERGAKTGVEHLPLSLDGTLKGDLKGFQS